MNNTTILIIIGVTILIILGAVGYLMFGTSDDDTGSGPPTFGCKIESAANYDANVEYAKNEDCRCGPNTTTAAPSRNELVSNTPIECTCANNTTTPGDAAPTGGQCVEGADLYANKRGCKNTTAANYNSAATRELVTHDRRGTNSCICGPHTRVGQNGAMTGTGCVCSNGGTPPNSCTPASVSDDTTCPRGSAKPAAGSSVCICGQYTSEPGAIRQGPSAQGCTCIAVSYTHLTLPTILLV